LFVLRRHNFWGYETLQKKQVWPRVVTVGNSSVKVYQTTHPRTKSGFVFVIAWRTLEGRRRKGFTSEVKALTEKTSCSKHLRMSTPS